jgi:PAT family beta-lactamase induction signal transducer AmpG
VLRERQGEKLAPWTAGKAAPENKQLQLNNWSTLFKSLFSVFKLRNSLLLAAILFICQGAFKYSATLFPIFTIQQLGWTNMEYSEHYATAKLIGGISGMLIGGFLIARFGKKPMMNVFFISTVILSATLALGKIYWNSFAFIYAYMILHNVLYTFACIGIFAIAMQCCWKKVSASQFTLYMTIANLGQIAFAAMIGPIRTHFNWSVTLLAFAVFIALAWLLLQRLNIQQQINGVANLENKDKEKQQTL